MRISVLSRVQLAGLSIAQPGYADSLPPYLRAKVILTNLLALSLGVICVPYLLFPFATGRLIPAIAWLGCLLALLASRAGRYHLARWCLIVVPAIAVWIFLVEQTPPNVPIPPGRFLLFGVLSLPLVLFDLRERRSLWASLLLILVLFFSTEPANDLWRSGTLNPHILHPVMSWVTLAGAACMVVLPMLYQVLLNYRGQQRMQALIDTDRELKDEQQAVLEDLNRHYQLLEESRNYARRLQASLLPPPQLLERCTQASFVWYQPRETVCGDFCWVYEHHGLLYLAVADFTGKGVPSAFLSVLASSLLYQVVQQAAAPQPGQILQDLDTQLNKQLALLASSGCPQNESLQAGLLVLNPETLTWRYAGAMLPLLHLSGGQLHTWPGTARSLGVAGLAGAIAQQEGSYLPDDIFLMYTDGITKQRGSARQFMLSRKRLHQFVAARASLSLPELHDQLKLLLADWQGKLPQTDDQVMLAIQGPRLPFGAGGSQRQAAFGSADTPAASFSPAEQG